MSVFDRTADRSRESSHTHPRISLIVGGPFSDLLGRLQLLSIDRLPGMGAAMLLAGVAWGIPAALVLLQEAFDPAYDAAGYFEDSRTWGRFLLAMALMMLAERSTEEHFARMIDRFHLLGLLPGAVADGFRELLAVADRRTSSRLAEGLMLLAAFTASAGTEQIRWIGSHDKWAGALEDGAVVHSWGGLAVTWISDPLFAFLFLRWMWRFVVLAWMMYGISRLPLRLWPLHPDRVGGLAFLGQFPAAFSGLVFALGCVLATGIHEHRTESFVDMDFMQLVTLGWVGFTLLITLGPLTFFAAPLGAARDHAREVYGVLVVRHLEAFDRAWIGTERHDQEMPPGDSSISSVSGLNDAIAPLLGMSVIPGGLAGVRWIGVASSVPMLVAMALQMSLDEAMKLVFGFLI